MRKQKHVDELLNQVNQLKVQNSFYSEQIDTTSQMYVSVASQNNVLRAQAAELTDRLKSLNCVIEIVAEANGLAVDIPEIPEILLEPWQLPCPIQPITASADTFQYWKDYLILLCYGVSMILLGVDCFLFIFVVLKILRFPDVC